ncbi:MULTISPECIES: SLBB domain-containing protein [unclassified Ectothiorhodospira]|uniref:SLBB domain-containing protein n=1 Tax=unclassified Ectothiorhodospira TaxID=2684909 RepID=UPI001EE9409A|nr:MULTISPECIES: SLBB domain-containing protein [unclassified Ectothiorhodospira]MCG5516842.1 SLBB domain-containing protein [Ectothiorhodospira sp. 9100]MCG5519904.1 SLBB domain-containing protein [Ectothiorhodospira sp. 9905]
MGYTRKITYWLLVLVIIAPAAVLSNQVLAQGLPPGVSQQQVEQFRSLPRSQQEALAREHGVDLDDYSSNGSRVERSQTADRQDTGRSQTADAQDLVQPIQDPDGLGEQAERLYDGLKPFGYDLFAGRPTTFAPATQIPVPSEYTLGPGDVLRIQMWGNENRQMELPVSRDGSIDMPNVGPVPVAGQSFDNVRSQLQSIIQETFIGAQSHVGLGELRSIQVFVLGEARNPGAYTVSSLSTITNALMVSGGVQHTGSLRNIQLKRRGEVIGDLDLYDLLLRGDTSGDLRLQPGDVIFVPPVGPTAGIRGEVRRPAVYELDGRQSLESLVRLAGGFTPDASPRFTQVMRVTERRQRNVIDVNMATSNGARTAVNNGDLVRVGSINDLVEGFVSIKGAVVRPGSYRWEPGLRVSDLIGSLSHDLDPDADLDYGLIVREIDPRRRIEVYQFSPGDAIHRPGSDRDPRLEDLDRVLIFSAHHQEEQRLENMTARPVMLEDVIERLERQSRPGDPLRVITVGGAVRFPGDYPLPADGTLKDLITAAGGLLDSAHILKAEIARFQRTESGEAHTRIIPVSLEEALRGSGQGPDLQGRDRLLIKHVPEYGQRITVTLDGEVRFPGEYTVRRGETLGELLERAGGLRDVAYPSGAIFSREQLREMERERLDDAQQRLRRDLIGLTLDQEAAGENAQVVGQLESLLAAVERAEPLGRMVIDLPAILEGRSAQRIVLQDGDELRVPPQPQSVSVFGEVQFATSHLHETGLTVDDYLERSGGTTGEADDSRVYVVQANGSVWLPRRSAWYEGASRRLQPGDTIVVPLKVDRVDQLQLWSGVSQVFYQLALGAAAINSF